MSEFFELFAKFNSEFMGLLFFLMLSFFSAVLFYFIYFRKSFSPKIHDIPESMVKNFNDTKSTPKSFDQLQNSSDMSLKNEVESLREEVSTYKSRLEDLDNVDNLNQKSVKETKKENENLKKEIEDLKNRLENVNEASTEGSVNHRLVEENEELELKLKEYEIIEKDLANLKQIQDENTRLKELLRGKDLEANFLDEFSVDAIEKGKAENSTKVVTSEPEEVIEPYSEQKITEDKEESEASSHIESSNIEKEEILEANSDEEEKIIDEDKEEQNKVEMKKENQEDELGEVVEIEKDGKEKSADELLSEFEKMLG